jgi:uncharacterized membrane protein
MSTWRYVQKNQPCGPVETPELQTLLHNGTLSPETLVWKVGMAHWAPARTLPELAQTAPAGATAPPIPPSVATPPNSVPPVSADADLADVEKNKIFAVIAYLGILFLVPLLAAPHSKYARYHTNQGLVLFLLTLALNGAATNHLFIPFIGGVSNVLSVAVGITALVLVIMGIVNAASGQCKPLPLIGQIQLLK